MIGKTPKDPYFKLEGKTVTALRKNVSEKDRNAALAAGMSAFTEKPIFVDRLFEAMEQVMPRE